MKLYILIATLIVAIALPSCIYQERADWQTTPTVNSHVNSRKPNTKLTECWTSADKKTKTLNVFFPCDDVCFYKLCVNINYTQSDTSYISIKGNSMAMRNLFVSNPQDIKGDWSSNIFIHGESNPLRNLWYDTSEPLEVEWKSKNLKRIQLNHGQKFTATDTVVIREKTRLGIACVEDTEVNFDVLICDTLLVTGPDVRNVKINTLIANVVYTGNRITYEDGRVTPIGPTVGKFIKKATMEEAEMEVIPAY
ncbi:MAG: hypothetical protein IKR17_10185 [Bacteroidales bacterium]|nr:hypothetical protein [Bacteroidales bacterium]